MNIKNELDKFDHFLMIMDDQLDALNEDAKKRGIMLDFSIASLDHLETLFMEMKERHSQDEINGLIVYFARYLGEVLIRNYGGKWALSLNDEKSVYHNTPVIVGHSKINDLEFSPIFTMRAFSIRGKKGFLKMAIDSDVNPNPIDLSDLQEN